MCPSEVSDIEHTIWQAYQDQGVVVWGIASREDDEIVGNFADDLDLSFPILMDYEAEVNQMYAMQMAFPTAAYPQDWVIGTDGIIVYANNTFEADEMIQAIERELE